MSYTNEMPHSVLAHAEGNTEAERSSSRIIPLDKSFLQASVRYLPLEGKSPEKNGSDWNTPQRAAELDAKVRNGYQGNIGIYLGAVGLNLVDVDLDLAKSYPEPKRFSALTKLARRVFPATGMVWGRDAQTLGHLVYRVPDLPDDAGNLKLYLPGTSRALMELRVNGQSLYEGVHPDTGMRLHHFERGEPAVVPYAELRSAFGFFGAVVLVSLIWEEGSRHDCSVALAGYLLRSGFTEQQAKDFLLAVCEITGDTEYRSRVADVMTTAARLAEEKQVVGLPTLLVRLPEPKLRRLGCTVEDWAKVFTTAIELAAQKPSRGRPSADSESEAEERARAAASKRLFEAARQYVQEVFMNEDRDCFLTVEWEGRWRTFDVEGADCREWLALLCRDLGIVPRDATLEEAALFLRAEAFGKEKRTVHFRVGGDSGARGYTYRDPITGEEIAAPPEYGTIYLDLGREDWQIVEIRPSGWRLIPYKECPVRFVRYPHTQPLPLPERVEPREVHRLQRYFRTTEATYPLMLMWILGAFKPDSSYPILCLRGQQGSGKSTTTRLLRALIDPAAFDHSSEPRNQDDLFVQAASCHLVAFDNLSHLSRELSDGLCRLATGGGLPKRKNFTNKDLVALRARCPIILNAIAEIVNASDLADRMLDVELVPISANERLTENEFWNSFRHEHPRILGAVLEGLVRAMRDWVELELPQVPRMADFAYWVCAGMQAYGYTPEQSLQILLGNKQDVNTALVERNPLAQAIVELMKDREEWVGTPSELLIALSRAVGEPAARALPHSAHSIGRRLISVEVPLQAVGIRIKRERTKQRFIRITRGKPVEDEPLALSHEENNGLATYETAKCRENVVASPPENEFKKGVYDVSDVCDVCFQDLEEGRGNGSLEPALDAESEVALLRQTILEWMESHEPFPLQLSGVRVAIPPSGWKYAVKWANPSQLREWVAQIGE